MKLSGVFAALPTPFDRQGKIYPKKMIQNISRWNRIGLAGYLVAGRVGEGHLLNSEEKRSVWECVAREAKTDATLLAGFDNQDVRDTIQLTKQAAEIGYQAAVISPPLQVRWGVTPSNAVSLYYRSIADQAGLPVVIEIPFLEGLGLLSEEAIVALAEHPNIIAVIDEYIGFPQGPHGCFPEGFSCLAGDVQDLASRLIAGCSGMVNGLAAVAPFFCLNLDGAVRTREHHAALDMEQRVRETVRLLLYHYGVPGLKYALDLNGYYGGPTR